MSDPLADFLTRIRNANAAGKTEVQVPYAKILERIAAILLKEGFLASVRHIGRGPKKILSLELRYENGRPVIENLKRISRPGKRVYLRADALRPVKSGYGIAILSTPKGIMTNREAKKHHVGGEVLCEVW